MPFFPSEFFKFFLSASWPPTPLSLAGWGLVNPGDTLSMGPNILQKGRTRFRNLSSSVLGSGQIIWEEGKPVGRGPRMHVDMDNFRNRVFWKACDKAKIRRRRLHDTRHSFASLLLSNGEPLKYVSAQLGHASIRMTADVYGHLEIGSNRAAVDRLPTLQITAKAEAATA